MEPNNSNYQQIPGFNFPIKKVLLYLLLASLTMLFLGVTISYLFHRISENLDPIQLPTIFYLNTILLLLTSYFMDQANKAYKRDDTEAYKRMLIFTLLMTLGFMAAQYVGWQQMVNKGMLLASSQGASYLYVISGLHLAHVLGGLPFLGWFVFIAFKRIKEPVSVLIYFSDPSKLMNLQLLTIYWHFLDVLWIYLVVFFLLVNLF
ncbi:MAG: cytochrome c oxidase subunit 3 [Bacteroidota bacterium]